MSSLSAYNSFIDVCVTQALTLETLFESALASGVSVTNTQMAGSAINIIKPNSSFLVPEISIYKKEDKNITIQSNQTFLDIALQTCGNLESLFDIALENNQSVSDALLVGQKITYKKGVADLEITQYLKSKKIAFATGKNMLLTTPQQILFEQGLFENGLFE